MSWVLIYNMGMSIGLTVTDIDKMTAGEILDLAYYKANQMEERKEETAGRNATQDDYDSF